MQDNPQQPLPTTFPASWPDILRLIMTQYGSLAFGLISLVVIWLTMVVPQLDRNQVSAEAQRLLLEDLHKLTDDQKEISTHIKQTSEILDKITLRMDKQ